MPPPETARAAKEPQTKDSIVGDFRREAKRHLHRKYNYNSCWKALSMNVVQTLPKVSFEVPLQHVSFPSNLLIFFGISK
jgi:hypothetical protein